MDPRHHAALDRGPATAEQPLGRSRLALGAAALLYVPFLAYVAIVATPAYGIAPAVTIFLPPVAVATLALALLLGAKRVRVLAWMVLALLATVLLENIAAIVGHEIGWAMRQGAQGTQAVVSGLAGSVSRLPYWLALALPLALAAASLRLR
jgi:hypothetical protein